MIEAPKSKLDRTFREVVEHHQRDLYKWAFRLTGNHHDAEDLSQEVFIKVYAGLSKFRGDSGMKTWIYRIAVNTYLNKRRKKALRFMKLQDNFEQTLPTNGTMFSKESSAGMDAELESVTGFVDQALKHLSPKEHMAFVLRHYNELSVKEVSKAMQVAEGTVKSLLFRAVQKLRKRLAFISEG